MQINFATKCPNTALKYLQKALPNYDITKENAAPILQLVDDGVIRIGDPLMYDGQAPVYPEAFCTDADKEIVKKWHNNLTKK